MNNFCYFLIINSINLSLIHLNCCYGLYVRSIWQPKKKKKKLFDLKTIDIRMKVPETVCWSLWSLAISERKRSYRQGADPANVQKLNFSISFFFFWIKNHFYVTGKSLYKTSIKVQHENTPEIALGPELSCWVDVSSLSIHSFTTKPWNSRIWKFQP